MPRFANLDIADKTMALRNRRAMSLGVIITFSILATMVIPFLLQKTAIAEFCVWLAILMAGGLIVAGLWSAGMLVFARDVKTDRWVDDRQSKAIISLLVSAFMAVVMFLAVWLVTSIGGSNWDSYTVLKSGGLITYILGGLLPVVAYTLVLHAVATRQVITSLGWRIATIICMAVSLMAPWFWSGYKLYSDYHVM